MNMIWIRIWHRDRRALDVRGEEPAGRRSATDAWHREPLVDAVVDVLFEIGTATCHGHRSAFATAINSVRRCCPIRSSGQCLLRESPTVPLRGGIGSTKVLIPSVPSAERMPVVQRAGSSGSQIVVGRGAGPMGATTG
jgi:hypothetical protein